MAKFSANLLFITLIAGILYMAPATTWAHCDSMDGPVITEAKTALETGKVKPLLKWVRPVDEDTIQDAFSKTRRVRKESEEARELADKYFFETLVRLHRASENAPYTGLKPAGTPEEKAIAAADRALKKGSAEDLVMIIRNEVEEGLRTRFQEAYEAKQKSSQSVEAGRDFVKAYVNFIHYAENLHKAAVGHAGHGGEQEKTGEKKQHAKSMSPEEALNKEHRVISLIINEIEKQADALENGGDFSAEKIDKSLKFFTNFADSCHHAKEERVYFPALREYGSEEQRELVEEKTEQHVQGRELIKDMKESLNDIQNGDSGAPDELAAAIRDYVSLMRGHIVTENRDLLTPAGGYLPPMEKEKIMEGFHHIETVELGEGFHEKYHKLAMDIAEE